MISQELQSEVLRLLITKLKQPIGRFPQVIFFCPRCNHHKPKLSVNLEAGLYNCWVCGSDQVGKPFCGSSLAQLLHELDLRIPPGLGNEYSVILATESLRQRLNSFSQTVKQDLTVYNTLFHKQFQNVLDIRNDYLREIYLNELINNRKLTPEKIAKYNIGILNNEKHVGRIIIPSYNEHGNVDYYISRSLFVQEPKYLNPVKDKTDIIFNELFLDFTKDVYVFEKFFDHVLVENSTCILGSTLSKDSKLLKKALFFNTTLIFCLDTDAALKQDKIINLVRQLGIKHRFVYNKTGKDFSQLQQFEIDKILSQQQSGKLNQLRNRLL